MREQGGILTRLERWVRQCAATAPNRSLTALGFLLLMTPMWLFLFGGLLYELAATSPALKRVLLSDPFNMLIGPVLIALWYGGPPSGLAMIVFSAGRAYLEYRKREPAYCKSDHRGLGTLFTTGLIWSVAFIGGIVAVPCFSVGFVLAIGTVPSVGPAVGIACGLILIAAGVLALVPIWFCVRSDMRKKRREANRGNSAKLRDIPLVAD